MRVTTLMSFYDEPPDLLHDVVLGLAGFADELVCLDGAYELYHDSKAQSPADNHNAIMAAALEIELPVTLVAPGRPFEGNEVEKRDRLFRLGDATHADWFYLVDGDFVSKIQPSAKDALSRIQENVAQVSLVERIGNKERYLAQPHPTLFRAIPGIRVGPTHYHYRVEGDDKYLWATSHENFHPQASMQDQIAVMHQHYRRNEWRRSCQWAYYMQRNTYDIEPHPDGTRTSDPGPAPAGVHDVQS